MRLPPSSSALFLLVFLLACSDGSGPGDGAEPRLLVLRTANAQQTLWEYEGDRVRQVTHDSVRFIYDVARAPDGRIAYITTFPPTPPTPYRLVELSADGRVVRNVTLQSVGSLQSAPTELSYSPDGTRLAWRTSADAVTDSLWVLDAGATTARGLAARLARELGDPEVILAPPVRWTPNGRIVFGRPRTLVALHASSGDPLPLADNLGHVADYDFTPDGRLAIVTRQPTAESARIVAQRVQGGTLVHVPNSPAAAPRAVRWTLDGQRLATTAVDSAVMNGQWRFFAVPQLMELDGSGTPLRIQGVSVSALHGWTGDGRLVITGGAPGVFSDYRDVFVGAFGGTATNVTGTPVADEARVVPLQR